MILVTYTLSESSSILSVKSILTVQRGYCKLSKNQFGSMLNTLENSNDDIVSGGLETLVTLIFL